MDLYTKNVMVTAIICRMIENVVMTIGIVYASVYFHRFSLLWFLLMPVIRAFEFRTRSRLDNNETSQTVE